MVGSGNIRRLAVAPWLVAALVATFACGSSKSDTSGSTNSEGGESPLGGTSGGGSGGAGAAAGLGGNLTKGGTGGTLTVGGGAGRAGKGGTGGGGGAQAGMSGTGASGGAAANGGSGTGGSGVGGGAAGDAAGGAAAGHAGSGGSAGMPAAPTFESCVTWQLETASKATSTITLTDGGVLFFRPGDATNTESVYNSSDIAISQADLTGDFDILVEYDHFQPGDAEPFRGPLFEAGVYFHDPSGYVYQASGSVGAGDGKLAVLVPDVDPQISLFDMIPDTLVDASGSIELARSDGILSVTLVINDVTNTLVATGSYDGGPFVLFLGIGLAGDSLGPADSSVRVTRVTVTGGGGTVMSDTFDCAQ